MLRCATPYRRVADGIREVRLGALKVTGIEDQIAERVRNRRGTEPYARWFGRTAGVPPPPTRLGCRGGLSESASLRYALAKTRP